jgi:hypothetical protein
VHRARIWFQRPKARLDYLSELVRMVNSFLAGMTLAKTNYGYLRRPDGGAHGDLDSVAHWFLSWAPVDVSALVQVSAFREAVRIDCPGPDTLAMEWLAWA